ncbi:MAG: PilN domain-containing protein [Gaiellaceae bacterium]
MPIDLKKEIKVSDLFKRGPKEPKAEKPPKEPKGPREPKPPKEGRRRRVKEPKETGAALASKSGPPILDIPLMRAFNLLPREELRSGETETRQNALPHILVALAGVLVFAALAAFYLSASADVTRKTSQVDDLRGDLASLQVPEKQPNQGGNTGVANLAGERSARTSALGTALADRLPWDRLLREIALVLPSDVVLLTLQANAPSPGSAGSTTIRTVALTGEAASQRSVARLISRLELVPELGDVTLQFATLSTEGDNDGIVSFSIVASIRQGAAA